MFILGIDPGYDRLGIAVISFDLKKRKISRIESLGLISASARGDWPQTLMEIYKDLTEILSKFTIEFVGVEQVVATSRSRRLMNVAEVTGVVKLAAAKRGISVSALYPSQIKRLITGRGNASKNVVRRYLESFLESGGYEGGIVDDTVDALAVAIASALIWSARYNRVKKLI